MQFSGRERLKNTEKRPIFDWRGIGKSRRNPKLALSDSGVISAQVLALFAALYVSPSDAIRFGT
jgi:hypothetical protein